MSLTCFLVDDDLDDQEIFCAGLEAITPKFTCITALNGKAALEMLAAGASPHIIFLDLNMPLMNGRQFLQEVKRLKIVQHIPIVVLTTSADANTKATMLELGAKEFITKPDKFSEWEKVLRVVIAKFFK